MAEQEALPDNGLDIIEVTVSLDRKVNTGNYETSGVFISAKAQVPRRGDPEKIVVGLIDWTKKQIDAVENRIRNKEPDKQPQKVEEKKEEKKEETRSQKAPVCPTHGTEMLPSKHPKPGASWYCPKHVGPELRDYCKEKM